MQVSKQLCNHFLERCQDKLVTLKMKRLNGNSFSFLTFLMLWNSTRCQEGVLFKCVLATTDYLTEVINLSVTSRIQCGLQCLLEMENNICTAFAFAKASNTCSCGRKRFAPVLDTGSKDRLQVVSSCPKISTGQFCFPPSPESNKTY